jgi:hypothetical protein
MRHFSQKKFPLMSIGPTHGRNEQKQHIAINFMQDHTFSSQTPTSYLMSCQSNRAMCPLLDIRLLIGKHHATI